MTLCWISVKKELGLKYPDVVSDPPNLLFREVAAMEG